MGVLSENKFNLWSNNRGGRRGIAQRPQRKILLRPLRISSG